MNNTLCNMCMIEDVATGHALVQHRLAKPTNPWCGLTFPGGHAAPDDVREVGDAGHHQPDHAANDDGGHEPHLGGGRRPRAPAWPS